MTITNEPLPLNQLYNMDCMEGMATFPDKYFDIAICDPPYGIGISNSAEIGYKGKNKFKRKQWDNEIPPPEYFAELERVAQHRIIWGGNYFPLPPTRCFVVWNKGEGFKGRTFAEAELAWTDYDRNAKVYTRDPLAMRDYDGKIHPTQKPVPLYQYLLNEFGTPGMRILDTHAGSASSLIACYRMGFSFVGFEIDADYYAAALARLDMERAQVSMFDEINRKLTGGVTDCYIWYAVILHPAKPPIAANASSNPPGALLCLIWTQCGKRSPAPAHTISA